MSALPRLAPHLLALLTAALMAACGGEQNDSSSGGTATSTVAITLRGVAAHGAPLTNATVRLLDASGNRVSTTATTHSADGSWQLSASVAPGPLLVQAAGTDAQGLPLVLHSAVAKVAEGSSLLHITPLTDAAVALALGSEPATVFAAGSAATAQLPALARLAGAATLLGTVVKANLSDAKITDLAKLDLFSDATFAATKTGQDLALETLAIGYGHSSTGTPLLQLANKLGPSPVEVTIDLVTASAELAKTAGTPASAITSTLKATTSPTSVAPTLAKLDDLVTSLNTVLASAATGGTGAAAGLSAAKLADGYTRHDGAEKTALEQDLARYASGRMQLGKPQVLGCVDEVADKAGCKLVAIAARLHDPSNTVVGHFINAVSYDNKTVGNNRWLLAGNGHPASLQVRSLAWRALAADGSALNSATAGQAQLMGVQLLVGNTATSATVQTPGGYVLPLAPCQRSQLCLLLPAATELAQSAQGALAEDAVFGGLHAWLGTADTSGSARYRASLVGSSGTVARSGVLRRAFAAAPATSRYPVPDGLGSSRPLQASALLAGLTLDWADWQAANPDMRLLALRSVHVDAANTAVVQQLATDAGPATRLLLPAPTLPSGFSPVRSTLWLSAVDSAGRAYTSSILAR